MRSGVRSFRNPTVPLAHARWTRTAEPARARFLLELGLRAFPGDGELRALLDGIGG